MRSSVLSTVLTVLSIAGGASAQGLTRIAPGQERNLPDAFAREFKREEWSAALAEKDLERREQSFDALLARARLDPVARAFLEELARDPAQGELAWTARLGLRELGRARFSAASPLLGTDPLGMAHRMDAMLQELLNGGLQAPLPGGLRPRALGLDSAGGRSVRLQQSEQGAKVEVLETIDGREDRRTYEGASLEEILAANPELERELGGLTLRVQPGQALDLDLGALGQARGSAPRNAEGRTFATPLAPKPKAPLQSDKLGVIVQPLTAEHAAELGLATGQGLYVERTQPGSYADLLGVTSGDVLLTLDGSSLAKPEDIERLMKARARDAELALVWLDGKGQRQEKSWKAR